MNTDMLISLALDTHLDRVRAGDRERFAGQAVAMTPRHSPMRGVRVSIGAALIALGSRVQGVANSLPDSSAVVPVLPAGRAAH